VTVSDQSIDFEPSGRDAPTDLVIQGCIINHSNRSPAVTLNGIDGPVPLVRCKFTDNIVRGGQIFCTDVNQLTIQNNVVVVTGLDTANRIPAQVQHGGATSSGGGAANSGAGRFLIGLGDPNTKVTGNIGDLFQRLYGGPATTLRVKESSPGTNTG
jgi:hypothetical protein